MSGFGIYSICAFHGAPVQVEDILDEMEDAALFLECARDIRSSTRVPCFENLLSEDPSFGIVLFLHVRSRAAPQGIPQISHPCITWLSAQFCSICRSRTCRRMQQAPTCLCVLTSLRMPDSLMGPAPPFPESKTPSMLLSVFQSSLRLECVHAYDTNVPTDFEF